MLRRTFLHSTGGVALAAPFSSGAAAGPAGAQDSSTPVADGGAPIKLGFDTYSLRAFRWKAIQLIDFAAAQKLDTIQISSLDDFESLEPAHLAQVKDHAERSGLVLDGGIGCVCPTSSSWSGAHGSAEEYITLGLTVAKAIGARAMRCFLGSRPDRLGSVPIERHMETVIAVFRSVRSRALDAGVTIALENHNGDVSAREVKTIIEESGKDFTGSNLDTGNPMWMMEDPLQVLEILGPYVATTHIRDSVLYTNPRGAAFQWVALGDGVIDFAKFRRRFVELCPNAKWQLEVITGRPPQPLPYLERDDWKAFPKMLAGDFAQFLAIERRGRPYAGFMMIADGLKHAPAPYAAALKEQQRYDLVRSLDCAKQQLGVGVRWRTA
ncbi:MAG: sugar phosphate isomerase/epimerase family protein [Bryobacteraceae bacterium]